MHFHVQTILLTHRTGVITIESNNSFFVSTSWSQWCYPLVIAYHDRVGASNIRDPHQQRTRHHHFYRGLQPVRSALYTHCCCSFKSVLQGLPVFGVRMPTSGIRPDSWTPRRLNRYPLVSTLICKFDYNLHVQYDMLTFCLARLNFCGYPV